MAAEKVTLIPLKNIPLIVSGDDLVHELSRAISVSAGGLEAGDIVVVAQKIISKAEGRLVDLTTIEPGKRALELAGVVDKDARLVELILRQSKSVIRASKGVLIVEHVCGFIMANAGIDQSNVAKREGREDVLLLPDDPDKSAGALRQGLEKTFNVDCGVLINDSFGRPWRNGVTGVALGASGLPAMVNLVGTEDLYGRALAVTEHGFGDEVAAAASLLMGQAGEAIPVVIVRGLLWDAPDAPASALLRDKQTDLFR